MGTTKEKKQMNRIVLALVALLTFNTAAFGHSKMSGSTPSDGATAAAGMETVALQFDRKVRLTVVTVQAAPKGTMLDAMMALEDSEGMEHMGDIDLNSELPKGFIDETEIQFGALPAGAYWLHWIAIAQDGHTMNGNVRFAVEAE